MTVSGGHCMTDIDLEHDYLKRVEKERRAVDTDLTVGPLEKFKRVWVADKAVIPFGVDWNKSLGDD
jgi:hypothetical protein